MNQQPEDRRTRPNGATRAVEHEDAERSGGPDRPPTPEEERRAEGLTSDPGVAARYREMAELGADAKGEGRIDLEHGGMKVDASDEPDDEPDDVG